MDVTLIRNVCVFERKRKKGGVRNERQEEQMSLNCNTLGNVLGLQQHARLE